MAALTAMMMLGAGGAMAQERPGSAPGAPVVLAPPKSLAPRPLGSAQEPAVPRSLPVPQDPAQRLRAVTPSPDAAAGSSRAPQARGISVDTLGEIDPNSVGVLDANTGGFGVAMWAGSSADTVARLLARIGRPAALPSARALARRLLLSAARPPRKKVVRSGSDSAPSLLARRLQLLLALGDVKSAKALLGVVPVHVAERAVGLAKLNTAFLMNDTSGACGEARAGIAKYDGMPWRKAMVFCQYLAGEGMAASIGAELLREQGVGDDAFFALTAMLGGDTEASFTVPAKLEPLHLAMMRVARVQISDTLADSAEALVLRTIAFSPNAALDARLTAAERAEAAGALEAQSLTQIYGAVTFAPGDITTALTNADTLSGPRGRALLYHAARAQKVPAAQVEVVAKAFVLARAQGRLATAVRAFLPVLEGIKPTEDLAWFATEAARAFYFAGRLELAGQWASLAKRAFPGQAPKPVTEVAPSSPSSMVAAGLPRPMGNAIKGPAGASSGISVEVRLWPFMAIVAAGADRKTAAGDAKSEVTGKGGSFAEGLNPALPPGSVSAPAEAPPEGPTAADALAEVRTVEPSRVVDPAAGAGPSVVREKLVTQAKVPSEPAFDRAMFARWRQARATGGGTATTADGALLLTLLDALGADVPPQAWLETVGPAREMSALPPPGLVAALDRGAKEGRVGETVLIALAVLGADAPGKIHPSVIGPVVRALVAIGLAGEARALALEVAFGAGL
jgi:hypothetical protein